VNSLNRLGRRWKAPLILPITATPTNVTKELFWDPVYHFGIGEYLASGYAPKVEYHIVTSFHTDKWAIVELVGTIRKAKEATDFEEKERLVKEARAMFDALMAKDVSVEKFARDIIERLPKEKNGTKTLWETIIFASSIYEADNIARALEEEAHILWYAIAYHSKNDKIDALERLVNPNDPCRIVVAVDKLNESIDLPIVSNIVFYRYTQDAKLYLQQFGRWLRWTWVVRYYDYIGGMSNFSWIWQIQERYMSAIKIPPPGWPIDPPILPPVVTSPVAPPPVPPVIEVPPTPLGGSPFGPDFVLGWGINPPMILKPLSTPVSPPIVSGSRSEPPLSVKEPYNIRWVDIDTPTIDMPESIKPVESPPTIPPPDTPYGSDELTFISGDLFAWTDTKNILLGAEHQINLADLGLFIEKISREIEAVKNIPLSEVIKFLRSYKDPVYYKNSRIDPLEIFHSLTASMPMRVVQSIKIWNIQFKDIRILRPHIKSKTVWQKFLKEIVFVWDIKSQKQKDNEFAIKLWNQLYNIISSDKKFYQKLYRIEHSRWYSIFIEWLKPDICVCMNHVWYPKAMSYHSGFPDGVLDKFFKWVKDRKYIETIPKMRNFYEM
jgi:hypothetical protein